MKLKWNVIRNNNRMCLEYSWQHWFWITVIFATSLISGVTSHPLSSYETLSTSLKSAALIQSAENSFQKTNNHDKTQLTSGIKSVPLISETSDTDVTFGGASELNAELLARDSDIASKPTTTTMATTSSSSSSTPSSSQLAAVTTTTTTTVTIAAESSSPATTTVISSTSNPSPPRREIVAALSLPNVNSTKNSPIIVSSTIATTVLTTVTESIDNSR